jgi:hypothetical protein
MANTLPSSENETDPGQTPDQSTKYSPSISPPSCVQPTTFLVLVGMTVGLVLDGDCIRDLLGAWVGIDIGSIYGLAV